MNESFLEKLPRPLDPVRSIKLKLAILMVGSGAVAFGYFSWRIGWIPTTTTAVAFVLALATSQVLAHGMTSPLREMTAAAGRMATGDYSRRVRATSRDEVGQLAEAFNRMATDLAAADRMRRELIANVSHELRTPITALTAVLENVIDGVTEPNPETLSTALAQTQRLGVLVSELLDLSSIDAGAIPLDREAVSIAALLDDVVAEAVVMTEALGLSGHFTVEVTPADATVPGDRARLHQVILNLVENAARHGPADGEVRLAAHVEPGQVVIDVVDNGPGIPHAERAHVFERFTRGERAADGGTGLGLSIARWVVDLHGGTIAVAEPGSRIRVTLPH